MLRIPALALAIHITTAAACGQTFNFSPPVAYPIPGDFASPAYIACGDIDADGDLDLVTDTNGPGDDPTPTLWNDGAGAFTLGPAPESGWGTGRVALGDMDGDADLDILRCNYFSNGVYFFRNTGGQNFDAGIFYSGGGGSLAVVFADIDNDADLDFVVTDKFGGQIRPYRNISGLGFTSVGLFACGAHPFGMDSGDVDADGDIDIVVTNEEDPTITVCYNDGTGRYPMNRAFTVGVRPVDVDLADLNDDGRLDAVVANWGDFSVTGNTVSALLNDGEGGFLDQGVFQAAARPEAVRAADFDGNGTVDLVVACGIDDEIAVLSGNGDGTFAAAQHFETGASPRGMTIGDFDGDGAVDVAFASFESNIVGVMRNNSAVPPKPPVIEVVWHVGHDNFFNFDTPSHVAVAANGDVIVAGSTAQSANRDDYYVVGFTPQGDVEWDAQYNGAGGDRFDRITDMALVPSGGAVVTGESWNADFGVQWATMKVNADGSTAWTRRYNAANTFSQQRPDGVAVDAAGNVAVCGYYINDEFDALFAVVYYDAAGTELWHAHFPAPGSPYTGWAHAVAFDAAGNIIAAGEMDDDDKFGTEMFVAKLSPTGGVLWTARHDASKDQFQNETVGSAIHVDAADNIYVAGHAQAAQGRDFVIVKYDPAGNVVWSHVRGEMNAGQATRIIELASGAVIVSGIGGSGVTLHAYDASGAPLWESTVAGTVNSRNPGGHITLGADGNLYILGQAGTNLAVFQMSTTGELLSTTELDSGFPNDAQAAITASPDNFLYVAAEYTPDPGRARDFSLFKLSVGARECPADFNGDAFVNSADFFSFITAFFAGAPASDFNADGFMNSQDFFAFLEAFFAGCP